MTDEEIDKLILRLPHSDGMTSEGSLIIANELRESRGEVARFTKIAHDLEDEVNGKTEELGAAWRETARLRGQAVTWHPVAERLPLEDETLLMYTKREDTFIGWYEGGLWHGGYSVLNTVDDVTHWAELPTGPHDAAEKDGTNNAE